MRYQRGFLAILARSVNARCLQQIAKVLQQVS